MNRFDNFLNEQLKIADEERKERLERERQIKIQEQEEQAQEEYEDIIATKNDVAVFKDFINNVYPKIIEEIITFNRNRLLVEGKNANISSRGYNYNDFGFSLRNVEMLDNFLERNGIGYTDTSYIYFRATLEQLIKAYYTELQFLPEMENNVNELMDDYVPKSNPKR